MPEVSNSGPELKKPDAVGPGKVKGPLGLVRVHGWGMSRRQWGETWNPWINIAIVYR